MIYFYHLESTLGDVQFKPEVADLDCMDSFLNALIKTYPELNNKPQYLIPLMNHLVGLCVQFYPTTLDGFGPHTIENCVDMLRYLKKTFPHIRVIFGDVAFLTPNELADVVICTLPTSLLHPLEYGKVQTDMVTNTRRRIHARYLYDRVGTNVGANKHPVCVGLVMDDLKMTPEPVTCVVPVVK